MISGMISGVRATAVLGVTYGVYNVEDGGIPVPGPGDDSDRIIEPGLAPEHGALINTGTFWGPVDVTVEVLDTPPAAATAGEWERVDDAVLTAVSDRIGVFPPDVDPPGLPELTISPASRYHLRVSVNGFQAGRAREQHDTGEAACEFHLVQLWPEA